MITYPQTSFRYQVDKQASPSLLPPPRPTRLQVYAILPIAILSMPPGLGDGKQRSLDLFQPLPSLVPFLSHSSNFPLFNSQRHL